MVSEWQEVVLSNAIDLIGGGTPKRSQPGYWGGGIPWLSVKDFNDDFRHIDSAEESITELGLAKSSTQILNKGQLIISARGTVGALAQLSISMAFNQSCYGINAKPEYATNDFLYYLLKFSIENLRKITHGAVFDTIIRTTFDFIKVRLPPLPEQKAIAHVLGTLDDRIELNRRMNETLEAMAQALFKSWFVDFDPVIDNALASGKEIPAEFSDRAAARAALGDKRQPLPAEIRTLFPDEFIDSAELGWIPKGWEVACYSKYAALNQASWTKKHTPQNVQYVDLSNTKDGKINLVVPYAFADAPSRARRILKKHDTIIGTVRPGNRSFAYVHKEGLTGSTGFAVMTPKEKRCRSFVYLGLTQDKVIENFAHLADGAAYPAIRPEVVANFEAVFPTADLIKSFDSYVYPWIEQMGKHEEQAGTLAQLRDTLLPKLLSGELRIPEAEKMVEELSL